MRVLWFTNILMPDIAKIFGIPTEVSGGWQNSQLKALQRHVLDLELFVLTPHRTHRRFYINDITYATFGNPNKPVYGNVVSTKLEREINELVRELDPDVIHIHGTENYYARLSSSVMCNKPVLVSLQGIMSALHPYYNGNLTPDEIEPFRTVRNIIFKDGIFETQRRWKLERSVQEKLSLNNYQHYAGRTSFDEKTLLSFNKKAIYHHLDEIMRPEFYLARRDLKNIRLHAIYCSSAASYPLKGLHWLLRAVALLKPQYPDIRIRVANAQKIIDNPRGLMAWLKDRDYFAYLRHLIQELGLQENVVSLPVLSETEVVDELKRAHIFCLPSMCENSPNSLGEAMLVGTPCVAFNVGGIPSMLTHDREGLLCPAADYVMLSEAIRRLFDNKRLAEKYSVDARQTALLRHDPQRVANETKKVYDLVRGN